MFIANTNNFSEKFETEEEAIEWLESITNPNETHKWVEETEPTE